MKNLVFHTKLVIAGYLVSIPMKSRVALTRDVLFLRWGFARSKRKTRQRVRTRRASDMAVSKSGK